MDEQGVSFLLTVIAAYLKAEGSEELAAGIRNFVVGWGRAVRSSDQTRSTASPGTGAAVPGEVHPVQRFLTYVWFSVKLGPRRVEPVPGHKQEVPLQVLASPGVRALGFRVPGESCLDKHHCWVL